MHSSLQTSCSPCIYLQWRHPNVFTLTNQFLQYANKHARSLASASLTNGTSSQTSAPVHHRLLEPAARTVSPVVQLLQHRPMKPTARPVYQSPAFQPAHQWTWVGRNQFQNPVSQSVTTRQHSRMSLWIYPSVQD